MKRLREVLHFQPHNTRTMLLTTALPTSSKYQDNMNDTTDKSRKTLSIKRKPADTGNDTNNLTGGAARRLGKRIIKREDLPADKLNRPGKFEPKEKLSKSKAKRPRKPPKAKKTPPSQLKARELNDRLNGFRVWLEYLPLALGVEKDLFRLVNDEHFPGASKRVIQRLLHGHTHHPRYLQNVASGGVRWTLNGEEAGAILLPEQEYVSRVMKESGGI